MSVVSIHIHVHVYRQVAVIHCVQLSLMFSLYLLAVRALITSLRSEPDSPTPGTNTGCLLAGDDVEIVCDHTSYPVGTIKFLKDGDDVDLGPHRYNVHCTSSSYTGV